MVWEPFNEVSNWAWDWDVFKVVKYTHLFNISLKSCLFKKSSIGLKCDKLIQIGDFFYIPLCAVHKSFDGDFKHGREFLFIAKPMKSRQRILPDMLIDAIEA